MDRRRFLQLTASGSLLLTLPPDSARATQGAAPNTYVELRPDGLVQLTIPRSEMGQGVRTALAMLIAEELEVPMQRVRTRMADADAARFGNQGTGSSASVRTRFIELRRAGASVREMLCQAAARRWAVEATACRARDGRIEHPASGRSIDYAELLTALADLPVPRDPPLKSRRDFRLIGRPQPAVDLVPKIRGQTRYGLDTRLPGMLHAAVARCPVFGGSLQAYDRQAALAVAGVRAVLELPAIPGNAAVSPGVAVIAENSWAALRGRDALVARWRAPPDPRTTPVSLVRPPPCSLNRPGISSTAAETRPASWPVPGESSAPITPPRGWRTRRWNR